MNIILASGSPRRHEILTDAGIPHTVRPVDADETLPAGISPRDAVTTLARRKALAAMKEFSPKKGESVIVAADTLVAFGSEIYGKPADREDAFRMISSMVGGCHSVFTGVCVTDGENVLVECEESLVFMRSATNEEIYSYIDRYKPYDKAGAYGIQEAAGLFVSRIEGDYSNIVGLPLCRTGLMLKEFGVKLF